VDRHRLGVRGGPGSEPQGAEYRVLASLGEGRVIAHQHASIRWHLISLG
jgi:hypothetical protein